MTEQERHQMDDSEQCQWCGEFKCCIDAHCNGGVRDSKGRLFCDVRHRREYVRDPA